jgi:hypothetical protein
MPNQIIKTIILNGYINKSLNTVQGNNSFYSNNQNTHVFCEKFKVYSKYFPLTLRLLMSYIYGAPCKVRNFNVVRLATLKTVSFYLLHNVSTLNQNRKLSCGTVVSKHFASYQSYRNYRWDLIRYAKG